MPLLFWSWGSPFSASFILELGFSFFSLIVMYNVVKQIAPTGVSDRKIRPIQIHHLPKEKTCAETYHICSTCQNKNLSRLNRYLKCRTKIKPTQITIYTQTTYSHYVSNIVISPNILRLVINHKQAHNLLKNRRQRSQTSHV